MTKCIICDTNNIKEYPRSGKKYPLKQCKNCSLVSDFNPPTQINQIYSEKYYASPDIKGGYFNYFEESSINKLTFKYRLDKIYKKTASKDILILDIGCALGDFLEVAKVNKWVNTIGTEVSDFAIKECQKKGLKVYRIEQLYNQKDNINRLFDVITMQDVVEHFVNPKEELKKISRLLKPGGLLFMTTPDENSISNKLFNKNWYHFKKGEHLFYFNKSTIKLLLSDLGFNSIEVRSTPSWVNIQYLIHRLGFYLPKPLKNSLNKLTNNFLCKITFPIYTGEIEIWAKRNN